MQVSTICVMEIIKGGDIFMLTDKNRRFCPISWKSNKVSIGARFTLAADTPAAETPDGTDSVVFIDQLAQEISLTKPSSTAIAFTVNTSLHDSINKTTQIRDQCLHVKMSALWKM